jgi:hypothetical protein
MSEWKPIKKAPKDKDLIGYCVGSGSYFLIHWSRFMRGWISDEHMVSVTHWMPLPDPPKEGE